MALALHVRPRLPLAGLLAHTPATNFSALTAACPLLTRNRRYAVWFGGSLLGCSAGFNDIGAPPAGFTYAGESTWILLALSRTCCVQQPACADATVVAVRIGCHNTACTAVIPSCSGDARAVHGERAWHCARQLRLSGVVKAACSACTGIASSSSSPCVAAGSPWGSAAQQLRHIVTLPQLFGTLHTHD